MRVWHCACCELLSINRPHECGRAFGGRGRDATRVAWTGGQHPHIDALACACCELLAINSHHEWGRALGGHGRTAGTQPGLRGQAVNTRTLINRIARVANSVPLNSLRTAAEHCVGAAGTREYTGVTWTSSALGTGPWSTHKGCHSAARNRMAVVKHTVLCVCCERNWLAFLLAHAECVARLIFTNP